jgi:hypothetical protein
MKRYMIMLFIIPIIPILIVSVPTTQSTFAGDKFKVEGEDDELKVQGEDDELKVQGEDVPELCEEANEDPDDSDFSCDPLRCIITERETGSRITSSSCL